VYSWIFIALLTWNGWNLMVVVGGGWWWLVVVGDVGDGDKRKSANLINLPS